MESQPQNPEFRNNPENFHPWYYLYSILTCYISINNGRVAVAKSACSSTIHILI